jgi:hypothetical protein
MGNCAGQAIIYRHVQAFELHSGTRKMKKKTEENKDDDEEEKDEKINKFV